VVLAAVIAMEAEAVLVVIYQAQTFWQLVVLIPSR
jgi:hypothetical protein